MNKTILIIQCLVMMCGCAPTNEDIAAFSNFVDSVKHRADSFHAVIDTEYFEVSIDPDDPTITQIDSVLTPIYAEQNMFYYKGKIAGIELGLIDKRNEVYERFNDLKSKAESHAKTSAEKKVVSEKASLFFSLYREFLPDSLNN